MKHEFICSQCNKAIVHESDFTTRYARDKDDNKICFDCCGINDANELKALQPKQKFSLYLDTNKKVITNWPGTFKIAVGFIQTGRHNMAGKRYDTWFNYEGKRYHAVQYGDNTQICHIKALAQ
jgi:uncharacterized lipoprotein NlpE involved in copper resistance